MNKCFCCLIDNLIKTLKGLKLTCDIPQPLQVEGDLTTTIDIPQPLEITGTITTDNPCYEAMVKILSQSQSYTEIVLQNGEQFQKVSDLTVENGIVSFSSQGQKIQTTVCNVEYVVL